MKREALLFAEWVTGKLSNVLFTGDPLARDVISTDGGGLASGSWAMVFSCEFVRRYLISVIIDRHRGTWLCVDIIITNGANDSTKMGGILSCSPRGV